MGITRYSTCHFAEVMFIEVRIKALGGEVRVLQECSYCGEVCELLPNPRTLDLDVELTLRRWKDGDCTLDDMFERVNKELQRAWQDVFTIAEERLQFDSYPKFKFEIQTLSWQPTDATDPDTEGAKSSEHPAVPQASPATPEKPLIKKESK